MAPRHQRQRQTRVERKLKLKQRAGTSLPGRKHVSSRSGKTEKFPCEKCSYVFKSPMELEAHMEAEHLQLSVGIGFEGSLKRVRIDPFFKKIDYGKPVEFMIDVLRDTIGLNDDTVAEDMASSYYEEPLKECGCIRCCRNFHCCGPGNDCRPGCGCLCDFDNEEEKEEEEEEQEEDDDGGNRGLREAAETQVVVISPQLREKYARQFRFRDGFDLRYKDYAEKVGWETYGLPDPLLPMSEQKIEFQDLYKKFAVLAIKRYNVMHGTNYRCLEFVEGNIAHFGVNEYYITFLAGEFAATGDYLRDEPNTFQAKIESAIVGGGRTYRNRVLFCRLKSEIDDTNI